MDHSALLAGFKHVHALSLGLTVLGGTQVVEVMGLLLDFVNREFIGPGGLPCSEESYIRRFRSPY